MADPVATIRPLESRIAQELDDDTALLRVVDEADPAPVHRVQTGRGRARRSVLEGVVEVGGWTVLGFPSLRQPGPAVRQTSTRALAIGVAAVPVVCIVAIVAITGSFAIFLYPRLLLFGTIGAGAMYVGIIRLSQMRRREVPKVTPTHTGVVGLVVSEEQLVVRYPDRTIAFPWASVVGVKVAAGADGLGAGEFTQISQQLLLTLRDGSVTETVLLHEMFESSEEMLTEYGRDVLGTLMAVADWITDRARMPTGRR